MTLRDIYTAYREGRFGIPHFQRGQVWQEGAKAALLESLYFDTPCGLIILWAPQEPTKHGIPLRVGHGVPTQLIVDGQQRIRAVCEVFHEVLEGSTQDVLRSRSSRERVWCLNIAAAAKLRALATDKHADQPLFLRVMNPRAPRARYRKNVVPLRELWRLAPADFADVLEARDGCWEDLLGQIEGVSRRLKTVEERTLFQVMLDDGVGEEHYDIGAVVELFNRVNSAGIRVEAEERAYATLIPLVKNTEKTVRKLFEALHGSDGEGARSDHVAARDNLLRRQREQTFGFKLFVRTYIQCVAQHCGLVPNTKNLSFDLLANAYVRACLERTDGRPELLWERSRDALTYVHAVLTSDDFLCCDDLRYCPDAASLAPAFAVCFRYPSMCAQGRRNRATGKDRRAHFLAWLLLTVYLAEPTRDERKDLCYDLARSQSLEECNAIVQAFERRVRVNSRVREGLQYAQSMQDRYLLLLYWLLRRRRAVDFSYRNVEQEKGGGAELVPGRETPLSSTCDPEKQHLVPYAVLKSFYPELEGRRGRAAKHEAHLIGNLTYISRELNGLEGLSSDAVKLEYEPGRNARAHMLDGRLAGLYDKAGKSAKTYERFCRARERRIGEEFVAWLSELRAQAERSLKLVPEARLFGWWELHVVDCGYPEEVQLALRPLLEREEVIHLTDSADESRRSSKKITLALDEDEIVARDRRPGAKHSFTTSPAQPRQAVRLLRKLTASLEDAE